MRIRIPGISLLLLSALAMAADEVPSKADPGDTDESGMEVVLVLGEQPGPGLWKVTSGEHVMYMLGEISPYPRKAKWTSRRFESLLANSQELLLDYSGYWRANHTETRKLAMAEMLPDGQKLKDLIPPELNKRVEATARKFDATGLEDLRPFAATNRLVVSAMEHMDMKNFSARYSTEQLARKSKVKVTNFAVQELPFEDRLRNWQQDANVACLEQLVATLGDGGLGVRKLANAWSTGDIPALRELVPAYSFSRDGFRSGKCAAAMHGGERQAANYKRKRTQAWLAQARRALKNNKRTIAVVPMSELFASDGYLAALRAEGYQVEEP